MPESSAITLPSVLASGPAQRVPVMVELTNGVQITGHILEWDAATLNLKLDTISHTTVKRCVHVRFTETDNDHSSTNNLSEYALSHQSTNARSIQTEKIVIDEKDPISLRCINSVVIRGACIRYIDFLPESTLTVSNWTVKNNNNLQEIIVAAQSVRPTLE